MIYNSFRRLYRKRKKEYIRIIEKKSEELNLLINNFYEVSLFDNSNLEIQTNPIDIVISNYTLIKDNEIEVSKNIWRRNCM